MLRATGSRSVGAHLPGDGSAHLAGQGATQDEVIQAQMVGRGLQVLGSRAGVGRPYGLVRLLCQLGLAPASQRRQTFLLIMISFLRIKISYSFYLHSNSLFTYLTVYRTCLLFLHLCFVSSIDGVANTFLHGPDHAWDI